MSRPVSKFAEWLARASIQDTFGLCGLLALVCWICCSLGRRFRHLPLRLQQVSWRSFLKAPTPGVLQWLDIPTYLQVGVLTALVVANTIVISLHAQTWADVQRRAGCLAVTHLVPLCSGFSFSLPAHVYYVERDTFYWAHRWLGRICVLHCLLHGSVLGANARNTSLGAPLAIPLLAGCSLLSILPWTLAAILRRWPQLGLKVHHMLASIATGALFYHLIDRVSSYRWVLLGGICAGCAWSAGTCLHTMWFHRSWRITSRRALARSFNQLLWLDIAVPMGWEAQPGQYVQLWMPRSGVRSFLQLPSFYVASVDTVQNAPGPPTTRTLRIVTRPRPGVTGRIAQAADHATYSTIHFPVCVLGPYGHPPDLGQYGTVVFVLEDIGLFRALPFIRHLVQESRSRRNTVRRLEVLWQVRLKHFNHPHWVGDEISQILELDHTQPVDRIRYRNRNCTRLKYHFHVINIGKEMARLMDGRGGTTAVSGMSALPFMHFGFARLTGISVRKQMDTRSKPSCKWWPDGDPFINGTSDTIAAPTEPSNIEREFEPGRTPTAMPAAYAVPEQTTRLSGETLVDNRRSWRSDDAVVGGNANHKKWVRQKITEGGV
ncbi:Pc24g01410 [Penicillium rubens Wisconsin 54-1255]|uniref:Pc24g01410 protein n=1 Tax=Penicillium rubens (strain ATCC 28089 / DSM 1075 / NRRL 1951 / Wisconsin 54-1255) TaxID=500485 RepID=B6HWT2_PENRW|nr:Pc24g01410 [Penicillium rubens Wisconsin 54-1255]